MNDVIPEALKLARSKIDSGPFAGKPLWLSEWSSDSPAMFAHVIRQVTGKVDSAILDVRGKWVYFDRSGCCQRLLTPVDRHDFTDESGNASYKPDQVTIAVTDIEHPRTGRDADSAKEASTGSVCRIKRRA